MARDQLDKFESQNKSNISQNNKQLKLEMEAQREFEESIASRKSCLQILIVIVEFLSNSMIKRGQCVLEAKSKEQQAIIAAGGASSPDAAGRKSAKHSGRSNV